MIAFLQGILVARYADRVELEVSAFGEDWTVGRDLTSGDAWCKK